MNNIEKLERSEILYKCTGNMILVSDIRNKIYMAKNTYIYVFIYVFIWFNISNIYIYIYITDTYIRERLTYTYITDLNKFSNSKSLEL